MDNIKQRFTELEQYALPEKVHARIMRRALFIKIRTPFAIMISLLVVNMLVSGWRVWTLLSEREAFSIAKALLEGFEVSWSFISDVATTLSDILPFAALVNFFISLLLIMYLAYVWRKIREFQRSNQLINQ